jgi:hypothetical protein
MPCDYVSRVGSPYQEDGVVVGTVICDVASEDIDGFRPVAECIEFNGKGVYEKGDQQVRLVYANYDQDEGIWRLVVLRPVVTHIDKMMDLLTKLQNKLQDQHGES